MCKFKEDLEKKKNIALNRQMSDIMGMEQFCRKGHLMFFFKICLRAREVISSLVGLVLFFLLELHLAVAGDFWQLAAQGLFGRVLRRTYSAND